MSCQPSYAQSTATRATPTAATGTGPEGSAGAADAAPGTGPGRRKITATMTMSPPTFRAVRTLPTRAPFFTPTMLIQVNSAIAAMLASLDVTGVSGTNAPR